MSRLFLILLAARPDTTYWALIVVIVAIALFTVIMLAGIWVFAVQRRKMRNETPPICTWEYSAEEWKHYAAAFDLSKDPAGNANVRITPTDIWIDDDRASLRKELDALRKCVTACRRRNDTLTFRVRWYARSTRGSVKSLFSHDFTLPVPSGHEADAERVVQFFNDGIAANSAKIAEITPDGSGSIFGEPGF